MNKTDKKQSFDINVLQKSDAGQDKSIEWLTAGLRFTLFAFVLWVIVSTTCIMVLIDKFSKCLQ